MNVTSLLSLGRLCSLKCLQWESWGILRSTSAVAFWTQAGEPTTTSPQKANRPASNKDAGAASPEPKEEPEEPFDNSTYKNLQHHSYTPFTFIDQELELTKYRLPQPSTGRPSPLH